jgi:hypothetical protein
VSTRTIMPSSVWLVTLVHAGVASRAPGARIHEAPEGARTRRDEPAPRGRVERCPYPSLLPMLTSHHARDARQCAGSSSYIRFCIDVWLLDYPHSDAPRSK